MLGGRVNRLLDPLRVANRQHRQPVRRPLENLLNPAKHQFAALIAIFIAGKHTIILPKLLDRLGEVTDDLELRSNGDLAFAFTFTFSMQPFKHLRAKKWLRAPVPISTHYDQLLRDKRRMRLDFQSAPMT